MNGRRLYREYAQSKGKQAKEFVKIEAGYFGEDDYLITKDNKGSEEKTCLDYKDMVNRIIRTKPN